SWKGQDRHAAGAHAKPAVFCAGVITTCPMRPICIFHADRRQEAVEDFNSALETAIAVRCLGQGQFVGRSQSKMVLSLMREGRGILTRWSVKRRRSEQIACSNSHRACAFWTPTSSARQA